MQLENNVRAIDCGSDVGQPGLGDRRPGRIAASFGDHIAIHGSASPL
jgi:hypothetical protein